MEHFSPAVNKKLPILYLFLSLTTALSYYFAMKLDFISSIGHFNNGSLPFIICVSALVISIALSSLSAYSSKKYRCKATYPTSYLLVSALLLVVSILVMIFGLREMRLTAVAEGGIISAIKFLPTDEKFLLAKYILTPFVGLFFALSFFTEMRISRIRTSVGILGALSVVSSLFAEYFNYGIPLNSPIRYLTLILDASIIIFIFSEARISMPKEDKRASYVMSVFASSLSSVMLGLSLGMTADRVFLHTENDPNPAIIQCFLALLVSYLALARLSALSENVKLKRKKSNTPQPAKDENSEENN